MHYIPSGPDSFYNLPREGGVAYAAQESWVQNETIRVRCKLHLIVTCVRTDTRLRITFCLVLHMMKSDTIRVRTTFAHHFIAYSSLQ